MSDGSETHYLNDAVAEMQAAFDDAARFADHGNALDALQRWPDKSGQLS